MAIAIVAVDPLDQKELHAVRPVDAGVHALRIPAISIRPPSPTCAEPRSSLG